MRTIPFNAKSIRTENEKEKRKKESFSPAGSKWSIVISGTPFGNRDLLHDRHPIKRQEQQTDARIKKRREQDSTSRQQETKEHTYSIALEVGLEWRT